MPNHLAKPPKHLLRTHPQLQTERFLSERAESRTPGRPRAAKRVFNGVAREPCLVVDATTCFPAPAPRHGSASRPPAPDRTPRDAVRGHVAPTAARGDLVPVLRSLLLLSLKTPLFAASPLYLSLSSSLPTLSPRGSRRRQRLRRRSRKLQPSPASARRRPGNKACRACSLPSSSMDLGSREVSDSGKGGS